MTPSDVEVSLMMCAWRSRRDWLDAAVTSALDDAADLELVLVDDGSETPVAELLTVEDPRIRHVRTAHGGQLAARDAGIAAARGRYLRFLDDDDVVVAGSTSLLLGLAAGRDDVIPYGAVTMCDEELRPRSTISSTLEGDVRVRCVLGEWDTRHVALLVPRRVVDLAGAWSTGLPVSADWDFVLRALEHATVVGTTEPVVLYRRHGASVSGRADLESGERARETIIERFLARNPELRGSGVERQARAAAATDRALAYAAAGDVTRTVSRLARAARYAPLDAARAALTAARLLAAGAVRSTRTRSAA